MFVKVRPKVRLIHKTFKTSKTGSHLIDSRGELNGVGCPSRLSCLILPSKVRLINKNEPDETPVEIEKRKELKRRNGYDYLYNL
jgi:hypothetical protein